MARLFAPRDQAVSANRKPRKAYRPRPVITDPLTLLRPASAEEKAAIMATFYSALDEIVSGSTPDENAWRLLSDSINTIETLTLSMRKLVPEEVMPTVNAAIAAMVGACNRFKAGQGMRLDGPGINAMRDILDIYRQALDGLTAREMAQAQAETQWRVNKLLHERGESAEVIAL